MAERRVLTHRLESRALDIVHVEREGEPPFSFLPFDDEQADAVEFVGDHHLLVISARRWAIWDLAARACTVNAKARSLSGLYLRPRAYSAKRQSLFVVDNERHDSNARCYLRELRLDGTLDRSIEQPQSAVSALATRADGRVVAACARLSRFSFAVIDPDTGARDVTELPATCEADTVGRTFSWITSISPDGRFGARWHLGSVARFPREAVGAFEQPGGRGALAAERWRDIRRGEAACYGSAVELYDIQTGRLDRRLLVDLQTPELLDAHRRKYGFVGAKREALQTIIDTVADEAPYREWDRHRQILFPDIPFADEAARKQSFERCFPFRHLLGHAIGWTPDGSGLLLTLPGDRQRVVGLDGSVGLATPIVWQMPGKVPPAVVTRFSRELTERSTIMIDVADDTSAAAIAALDTVAARIEAGIGALLFRDALTFVFRQGRRRIGETTFFKELGTRSDRALFVPALRRIVGSFGAQAKMIRPAAHEQFLLGERSRPEHWRTALAPAALLLAEADAEAGDHLRDWFLCVDQEHDSFAASRVMPAFARTSAFAGESAIRFGLFFLLQQWQTLPYDPGRLRLLQGARLFPAAVVSQWIATEAAAIADTPNRSRGVSTGLLKHLLTSGRAWDDGVLRALPS